MISKNSCCLLRTTEVSTFLCQCLVKCLGLKIGAENPPGVGVVFLWWVYFLQKNGFPKKLQERNFKKKIFQIRIRKSDITSDGANSRIVLFNGEVTGQNRPPSAFYQGMPHIYMKFHSAEGNGIRKDYAGASDSRTADKKNTSLKWFRQHRISPGTGMI